MRIIVIGARGFPGVQGGVEMHCEELYSRLAKKEDLNITVIAIDKYSNIITKNWGNIKFKHVKSIKSKNLEKIYYGLKALVYTVLKQPDIVHFHGMGLYVPLVKLFGIKVVCTQHSMDYLYPKWGRIAKYALKAAEWGGLKADRVIAVSKIIYEHLRKYTDKVFFIPNGVNIDHLELTMDEEKEILNKYGLTKRSYIFFAGRITEEKSIEDLIKAFIQLNNNNFKLVIAGDADHETEYSRMINELAVKSANIILTGFITGKELQTLFSNAKLFVLPSKYEGLPIALLEALGYGIEVIASDIEANKLIDLNESNYFKQGDIEDIKSKMSYFLNADITEKEKSRRLEMLRHDFNWDEISQKIYRLYKELS